jgi:spermidine synthase
MLFSTKNRFLFLASSFLAGFSLMTVELAASRIIAPYVGSSIYTWTSVIGVILLGLSFGYYLGGFFSDKYSDKNIIFWEYLFSSISVSFVPLVAPLAKSFFKLSLSLPLLIFLISFVLFFVPSVFLGSLSPSILKKYVNSLGEVGRNAGFLSALWSLGSIVGTFFTGFIFIGYVGTKETFFIISLIIFLNSLFFLETKKELFWLIFLFSLCFFAILFLNKEFFKSENLVFFKESNYYQIKVVDGQFNGADDARILFLDFDSHSIESKSKKFLGVYPDVYPLFSVFKKDIKDIFVIGGGSYSLPKNFSDFYEGSFVKVAELDPEVKKTADVFFNLEKYKTISTKFGDGRMILENDSNKYDLIFEDAFNSFISIPWHLATKEFTAVVKNHLKEGGIYALNFIANSQGKDSLFFQSMVKTFKEVFSNSYVFIVGDLSYFPQNIILIGVNSNIHKKADFLRLRLSFLKNGSWLAQNFYDLNDFSDSNGILITDNFAPLERLMIPVVNKYFSPYSLFYYSFLN